MNEILSHIVLTGICLILRPDAASPPKAVVFPQGRSNASGPLNPEHNLYLAVEETPYEITQLPINTLPVKRMVGYGGKYYSVIVLNERLLEVTSVKEGSLEDAIDGVPRIRDIWPRILGGPHKEPAELHLDKRPASLKERINSRLKLPNGKLSIRYNSVDRWRFEPGVLFHSNLETRIPQELQVVSTILGSGLTFAVRDAETNDLQVLLTITPKTGKVVTALLAHVPKEDLFPNDVCKTEVDCSKQAHHICCTDHHFALYYKAYDDPPNDPPVPHKLLQGAIAPGDPSVLLARVGGSNCGPVQFP